MVTTQVKWHQVPAWHTQKVSANSFCSREALQWNTFTLQSMWELGVQPDDFAITDYINTSRQQEMLLFKCKFPVQHKQYCWQHPLDLLNLPEFSQRFFNHSPFLPHELLFPSTLRFVEAFKSCRLRLATRCWVSHPTFVGQHLGGPFVDIENVGEGPWPRTAPTTIVVNGVVGHPINKWPYGWATGFFFGHGMSPKWSFYCRKLYNGG